MKNQHWIADNVLFVVLRSPKYGDQIAKFDSADVPFLSSLPGRIFPFYSKTVKSFYARVHLIEAGMRKSKAVHRLLLNTPATLEVDHKNHDTLDNRRLNIWNVPRLVNVRNRKCPAKGYTVARQKHNSSARPWSLIDTSVRPMKYLGAFASKEAGIAAWETRVLR